MNAWLRSVFFLLCVSSTMFAANGRDMVREAEIESELAKLAPALVEPFRNARIALDAENYAETERLLDPICKQLPGFAPALRRMGTALAQQGQQSRGVYYCEQAVEIDPSAANLVTLASTLAFQKGGKAPPADVERAYSMLLAARSTAAGEDHDLLALTAQLALQLGHTAEARTTIALLESKHADTLATHYLSAMVAATDGHWMRAEREIRRAEKLGLSAEATQQFLDSGVQSQAQTWRIGTYTGAVIAAWALGLGTLFCAGVLLSKLTLSHASRADGSLAVTEGERRLRRIYRSVVNVAGVYYYISLPIVLLIVIGATGAIFYGFILLGRIPIKLLLILGFGALATVWTMGRSLLLRVKHTDPGRLLKRDEAEALWQLTDDVARTMNTRPIDEIRLTEGTDLAVYERGTWREKLDNKAHRILILGTAVIDGFKQDDFRSVLAHEYGHFANRDTAGGDVAMRVQNDMLKFYRAIVEAGQATWINVAFHFLRLYHFIFRRISHGATRLQEILADRVAAQTFGAVAFEGGLRHVIRQSIVFGHRADREIQDAIKAGRPLQNLYLATPSENSGQEDEFNQAINRPTTEDDTHPGPMDRFRMIANIAAPTQPPAEGYVWDLFKDRAAIEAEMMKTIEENVARHRG